MKNIKFDKVWDVYLKSNNNQSIKSAETSRIQVPRSISFIKSLTKDSKNLTLLDIGCGKGFFKFQKAVEESNITYFGCDPFNKNFEENIDSISHCMSGQSDIVTLNNVLNTIPEKEVWVNILEQAKNALNPLNGILVTIVYEGMKLSSELKQEKEQNIKLELTPIKTRDGFQHRLKTSEYLETIKSVFSNSVIVNTKSGKLILSSLNKDIILTDLV